MLGRSITIIFQCIPPMGRCQEFWAPWMDMTTGPYPTHLTTRMLYIFHIYSLTLKAPFDIDTKSVIYLKILNNLYI